MDNITTLFDHVREDSRDIAEQLRAIIAQVDAMLETLKQGEE